MNILVTGPPGSGKTTCVSRAADLLRDAGADVSGFVTTEVRREGRRVGFDLVPLAGGPVPLARVGMGSSVTVGRYGVDTEAVRRHGIPALDPAADVVVVDEIAPMEVACPGFVAAVERVLDGPVPLLGTIHARSGGEVARIRGRADVTLVDLREVDREGLPRRLAERLAAG